MTYRRLRHYFIQKPKRIFKHIIKETIRFRGVRRWFRMYGSSVILPIIALSVLAAGIYCYILQADKRIEEANNEETIIIYEE